MSKSVLLVDDDKIISFLTANSIKQSSNVDEVMVAFDGNEAISILESMDAEDHPDFILLDISMPKMNGFEFLDIYYKKGLNIKAKIAIYTGSIETADKQKASKYDDVIDFIVKPLSVEKLEEIIARL